MSINFDLTKRRYPRVRKLGVFIDKHDTTYGPFTIVIVTGSTDKQTWEWDWSFFWIIRQFYRADGDRNARSSESRAKRGPEIEMK